VSSQWFQANIQFVMDYLSGRRDLVFGMTCERHPIWLSTPSRLKMNRDIHREEF